MKIKKIYLVMVNNVDIGGRDAAGVLQVVVLRLIRLLETI